MRCWQFNVWLVCAIAMRQRGHGQDLPQRSSSEKLPNIKPGDRVFRQTCFSQSIVFSHFLQADPHFPFSGVISLGRGKGPKGEAGISLLGLPEQSVTDWVACTTEIHFLLLKIIFKIYFGCAGCLLLHRLFSSCGEWQLLSSCSAQASNSGGSLVSEHGF